ncbi:hypothetical protein FOS14_15190 [Skermania sp. ID1734]|uniref:hypothetical protein n=1 Tax=Skermania sp. ID1734 TaxID=2597516 RepID=UPI00117C8B71|nr:hypothetical protein [Skermania sp. ID1734]TSD97322.1 hypothetical protein FOS14_15190 [Skermania sp. ID1734]
MSQSPTHDATSSVAAPKPVRWAGALVAAEGAVAVGVAVVLVIRGLLGHDESKISGYGTAVWFAVLGGAVLAAGVGLFRAHRWGRTIAVVAQILLLPVAWALLTDSHQPVFGAILAVAVIAILVLLFSPPATRWMAQQYASDTTGQPGDR